MRERLGAAFRTVYRYARRFAVTIGVVVAVIVVSTLTIDLGPVLKARAERAGSNWLERQLTIGRLGVHLGRGRFVVEDLRIGGMLPHEPPWLEAKRIEVSLTWSALFGREVLLDSIEMSDWRMVVESFPDGRQTFPRLTGPPRPPRTGPRPVVTTLQYVRAQRGELVFNDYGSDWRAIARNLDVTVGKTGDYRGQAQFTNGTIVIQKYEPMTASLSTSFKIVDGRIVMERIDLLTDGAVSQMTGVVDMARWPEQIYQIKSRVEFPKMREIFFARDRFTLFGEGQFTGTFRMFKGGRELKGDFRSELAGVNDYRFPNLEGSLIWVRDRMEVTRATAGFSGGKASFRYLMAPLGKKETPARAVFDVDYQDVDLSALTEFYQMRGLRLAGRASGRNEMSWPLGRFRERSGSGTATFVSTGGGSLQGPQLPAEAAEEARARYLLHGPFSRHTPLTPIAVAGEVNYAFDPEAIFFEPSRIYTPDTYVAFEGATAYGERSKMPFRVTSRNWQESDRFLAGIMTAFGATTGAIPIDGVGRFEGVMLGAFRRPRIEGRFVGSEMRAWDVNWGDVDGDFVVENSYANVSRAVIRSGLSRMDVTGQFSLGYPRADGGEQIDARIRVTDREVADFRQAFDLQDYDIDGVLSGDFHVYGDYEGPHGFGRMSIVRGMAYDELFSEAVASLRFDGVGVGLTGIEMKKGGGAVTGAAYVGWNGTYSFNVDGRAIAVDTLTLTTFPGYPSLYGSLDFTANGVGTFEEPRYDVKFSASDLFFGEEGLGEMTGRLSMRGLLMTYEMEAASPRLAVSGTGRVELNDEMDAEMTFRVTDTSLDPYVRVLQPTFSPFTSAVASGTIRVVGELYNQDALRIDTNIDQLNLAFLDYRLRNAAPIRLSVERQTLNVDALRMVGDDTELDLTGTVNLAEQTLALQANGAANLAVLQGFLPNVRSSGRAEVTARISGTVAQPVVAGNALLANGRLRQLDFPHALEGVNGIVTFDAAGVRLDGVTAQLGGGAVRFGGRIGLSKYQLSEFDVTATGENMTLRYPEGMRSLVDASLALQGPANAPMVTGTVTVNSGTWTRGFGATGGLFSGLAGDPAAVPAVEGQVAATASNVRFDIQLRAPSSLRIENEQARIVASADLTLRGTLDRPLVFGRAEIERGEVEFEGRRYLITRGTLDFADANRIQPFFDIEAETRVRVPQQTYLVTMRMAGTTERMQPQFTSDPPLQTLDILTLLFSDQAPSGDVELAGLQRPDERQQRLVEARATRALTGALSAEVGRVVEQTFGVDTFQITPLLNDPYQQSTSLTLNPTARVTIGKRISDRIFLTYARSLSSTTRDQIILLEFDESESLSWVLSQNEDRTYALEVRKRHAF
ncbi:MAG TPA: translocation/assembly module TamB domain-containing protein [Vicinamibacterales bacterium]|nr:translocation/assembly module TamB domain-containing protein [Vicinamibacterales bacterium]